MFDSFFMAGFECATGLNRHGHWIDQVCATEHDRHLDEDYARVRQLGIRVAREGVRWPEVDRADGYDFSSLREVIEIARRHGIQIIYDLFHYGYPLDLDPFSDEFVFRFAEYCRAVALVISEHDVGIPYFTPVNEPSYLAWAAGDAAQFAPHATGRSFELKLNLIRAAIAGIDAIRSVMPHARMVNVDPICRVVPPPERPDLADEARYFNDHVVFEAWDILAGRIHPELGGSPAHLDIVGLNYYWTNQWEHTRPGIPLASDDDRQWPLRDLVRWVWHRYRHDIVITETAHSGDLRPGWIRTVADELVAALDDSIPVRGACLYPILGMPEWHSPDEWARMGLWDLEPGDGGLHRVPHEPSLVQLREAQLRLEGLNFPAQGVPRILSGDPFLH